MPAVGSWPPYEDEGPVFAEAAWPPYEKDEGPAAREPAVEAGAAALGSVSTDGSQGGDSAREPEEVSGSAAEVEASGFIHVVSIV